MQLHEALYTEPINRQPEPEHLPAATRQRASQSSDDYLTADSPSLATRAPVNRAALAAPAVACSRGKPPGRAASDAIAAEITAAATCRMNVTRGRPQVTRRRHGTPRRDDK